jgi:hypothetical protein
MSFGMELTESLESRVELCEDNWEDMATRQLAVAAENWIESSGVGSFQMMEESKDFS